MKIIKYVYLSITVFSLFHCFNKPVKPNLPPTIYQIEPLKDSFFYEGEKILFSATSEDEQPLEQFNLYINNELISSIPSDTFHLYYSTTGMEGDYSYFFQMIGIQEDTAYSQNRNFTVIPHSFSILSPNENNYIGDSIFFKLTNPNNKTSRFISLKNGNSLFKSIDYQEHFIVDIKTFETTNHTITICISDSNEQELSSVSFPFRKVNDPIIEFPDTLIEQSSNNFILPLKIINANSLYGLELKILFDKNLSSNKIETTELTENYYVFNPQFFSDKISITFYTKQENYIDVNGTIFLLYFTFKEPPKVDDHYIFYLSKERALVYEDSTKDITLYTNDSFVQIKKEN